jgi:hypothetical protein
MWPSGRPPGDGQARVNDYHHPENYLVEHNVDEQDD